MLVEFEGKVAACRAKFLAPKEKFYYFFFIATDEEERRKGLGASIIRYYQDVARREGVTLWLEATTENSMRLYARLGFELVEVMLLGKGKVGIDGVEKRDGEGVRLWGMVWRPGKEDVLST
jgi:GNAT superfamily N-acetyltransferase